LHYLLGSPHNRWTPEHDTGGSSGGSGAATAAALCAVSLGEDTGGSVRSPASWGGVAGPPPTVGVVSAGRWGAVSGHRPTWGLVSRAGCIPLAWSLDAPGPLGRTVEDCALVLGLIAGHDPRDPRRARRTVPDHAG